MPLEDLPDFTEPEGPSPIFRFLRKLISYLRKEWEPWPDSDPSGLGDARDICVVIDGLGSSSYTTPRFTPLLETISNELRRTCECAQLAFSYRQAGTHYTSGYTNVNLRAAQPKMRRYRPGANASARWTYIAFSLGASLCQVGLARLMNEDSTCFTPQHIRALILLQPALDLKPEMMAEAQRERDAQREIPAIVAQLITGRKRVHEALVTSAATLVGANIDLCLLYWAHDPFLDFPPELMSRLQHIGVTLRSLNHDDPADDLKGLKAFAAHANVPHAEGVIAQLMAELAARC